MNSSELVRRWRRFENQYPQDAKAIRKIICDLYASRQDQKEFDQHLALLQDELSDKYCRELGVNAADRYSLAAWALSMGFLALIQKVRNTAGHHA